MTSQSPYRHPICLTPDFLQPGDLVEFYIGGKLTGSRYGTWKEAAVIETIIDDNRNGPQTVFASAPGFGSFRFTWLDGRRWCHGEAINPIKVRFKSRPIDNVENP